MVKLFGNKLTLQPFQPEKDNDEFGITGKNKQMASIEGFQPMTISY